MLHTSDNRINTVYVINIEFKNYCIVISCCCMLYVTIQVQQPFLNLTVTDTKQIKFFNTEPGYIL